MNSYKILVILVLSDILRKLLLAMRAGDKLRTRKMHSTFFLRFEFPVSSSSLKKENSFGGHVEEGGGDLRTPVRAGRTGVRGAASRVGGTARTVGGLVGLLMKFLTITLQMNHFLAILISAVSAYGSTPC